MPTTYNSLKWTPTSILRYSRSFHPLDLSCSTTDLLRLATLASLPQASPFTYLTSNPEDRVLVKDLRDLISPSNPINQQVINLYLQPLCNQFNIKMLDSGFYSNHRQCGWDAVHSWFLHQSSRRRWSPTTPAISGDLSITIPCHVHGCHWVAITRREIDGRVVFLYTDDMNNLVTETQVRSTLSSGDAQFFPATASWITCQNYTYQPHFNKCGIRTLLALSIQAIHPCPSPSILLPYMHGNLSQIGRAWIALSLLNSAIPQAPLYWILSHPLEPFQTTLQASTPHSIIPWDPVTLAPENQHALIKKDLLTKKSPLSSCQSSLPLVPRQVLGPSPSTLGINDIQIDQPQIIHIVHTPISDPILKTQCSSTREDLHNKQSLCSSITTSSLNPHANAFTPSTLSSTSAHGSANFCPSNGSHILPRDHQQKLGHLKHSSLSSGRHGNCLTPNTPNPSSSHRGFLT
jgi:hypothetical protein